MFVGIALVMIFVYGGLGITIRPNQVYRCVNKIPSPKEKGMVTRKGEHPLPSTERVIEVFTHMSQELEKPICNIYWSQMTHKVPNVNITTNTTRGKGTRYALIMGQVFMDKKENNSCVWHTPY